ncbi:hypothetical protein LCGC14_2029020 [marine sediment metagenome]|uniref:Uncharacterized protein n=1 Tax=marine sediment metagenome TaxID=412755 RepID=A0A0F9FHR8_9ZZZZ
MSTIANVRRGLEIFEKYKGAKSYCTNAEHDVLYGPEGGDNVQTDEAGEFVSCDQPYDEDMKKLTDKDRKKLLSWDWFIDSDTGHWAIFT